MFTRASVRYLYVFAVLALLGLVFSLSAVPGAAVGHQGPLTVAGIETLGLVTFPTGFEFAGTEVGGLSGIAYDPYRDVYYVLSDADVPHYYTVAIDVADGSLDPGDVTFLEVTYLLNHTGSPYVPLDAESIVMVQPGILYVSAEGDMEADPAIPPTVDRFNPTGKQNRALPIPEKFLPGGDNSVRDNLAFEGLTVDPAREFLYAATENALVADGPIASLTAESPSRVLQLSLAPLAPAAEFVYVVEPIPQAPAPPSTVADNGLSDFEALDNHGTFLAMERSFAVGIGNTIRLFETSTRGATDVSGIEVLGPAGTYQPMDKQLLADFETDLGVDPDNLEAMRFGPTLPDGRRLLIVVSDNNFRSSQTTQFVALAVALEPGN